MTRPTERSTVEQHEVELILMKQVASYLAMPIFLVDPAGNLLYFNEPAEALLGRRYDETGEMSLDEWGTIFTPTDPDDPGRVLAPDELPLAIAVQRRRPAQGRVAITGLDGVGRVLSVTAFPLVGQIGRELGAVAIFWEEREGDEPWT